jgi:hypothetical protein
MIRRLFSFAPRIAYSFPVQLLLNNLKRNVVLLFCWVILFAMITGSFGKYLGIPYLFLDPEYLNTVGFTSFFIMGLATAGFVMAFHISCYIIDGHRFSFVGTLPRPFFKFSLNNSIIPTLLFRHCSSVSTSTRSYDFKSTTNTLLLPDWLSTWPG